MAKFLLVVKSQDQPNVNTAVNVANGLRMMGAEDVRVVFLGPGITALDKKGKLSEIVSKNLDALRKNSVKVYACEMAMKNYNVSREELVHADEISRGADVIVKFANEGYTILTF
ncbi:hypothetical protein L3N51_01765 [Metallosphaera sp. J1]|uniref:DsrE family protein n=1 Tax=Metallosphaera javensis (ex Hofmann et al. 2022) TaxID=99938 RepID=UPI001EE045E7|nr:DsrE family protein [Metallosphaera javensis (ex Hofmann et al. 2022)]MCG3109473.1 hypothetical protein [Metallosphaera javensis (ex Hofmann et al. 2022)]